MTFKPHRKSIERIIRETDQLPFDDDPREMINQLIKMGTYSRKDTGKIMKGIAELKKEKMKLNRLKADLMEAIAKSQTVDELLPVLTKGVEQAHQLK
ncbi:MAG: hypothetical protein F6K03_15815 [Kamptonema sp. SIO4C4]|nr:hypothetical protein [Kamptonema sp. SIO4C4]